VTTLSISSMGFGGEPLFEVDSSSISRIKDEKM
jgi:hypothetical protein